MDNNLKVILDEWKSKNGGMNLPNWDAIVGIGLYMDQVTALVNQYFDMALVTPAMINNYVKLKIMPAPSKKKYSRLHVAYIIMICVLKTSMSMSGIRKIIPWNLPEERVRSIYDNLIKSCGRALDYISRHIDTVCEENAEDAVLQFALSAVLYTGLTEKIALGGESEK